MRRERAVRLVAALLGATLALCGPRTPVVWAADAGDGATSQNTEQTSGEADTGTLAGQPPATADAAGKTAGDASSNGDPASRASAQAAAEGGEGDAAEGGSGSATDSSPSAGTSDEAAYPSSAWPQFKGAHADGSTTAATPTVGGKLAWSATPDGQTGFSSRSDPIIVGNSLYMAEGSGKAAALYELSLADGKVSQRLALPAPIDSTSRVVYDQDTGLILVPLHGGQVQAVRIGADGLEAVWTSELIDKDEQTLTTPLLSDGRLFFGTTDGTSPSKKGHLVCLDEATGKVRWSISTGVGYYWAGAAMTSRGLLVGDDAGNLTLRNQEDGSEVARVDLGGPIRTTTVLSRDGATAYVVTRDDGTLHVVDVATLTDHPVKFCDYSTSTPTVVGGVAYVGGSLGGAGGIFAVDVSDPSKPAVKAAAGSLKTGATVGEVKSTPLVSVQSDGTYVYFTANSKPGAVYVYRMGDRGFRLLFQPEQSEYCFSSPVCDADGSLYYTNDSSVLFKVAASDTEVPQPEPEPESQPEPPAAEQGPAGDGPGKTTQPPAGGGAGSGRSGSRKGGGSPGSVVPGADVGGRGAAATTSSAVQPTSVSAVARDDEGDDAGAVDDGEPAEETDGSDASAAAPDDQPVRADPAEEPQRRIPVWPIVGIAVGVVVLVLVVAWPRLSERWHRHGKE